MFEIEPITKYLNLLNVSIESICKFVMCFSEQIKNDSKDERYVTDVFVIAVLFS